MSAKILGAGKPNKVTPEEGNSCFTWKVKLTSLHLSMRAFIALLEEGVSDSVLRVVIKKTSEEGCLCLGQDTRVNLILGQTKVTVLLGKQTLLQQLKVLKRRKCQEE